MCYEIKFRNKVTEVERVNNLPTDLTVYAKVVEPAFKAIFLTS